MIKDWSWCSADGPPSSFKVDFFLGHPVGLTMATIKSSWDCQAIDEKLGVAADAVVVDASETDNEGGILASVAALPQSVIENSCTCDLGDDDSNW